MRIPNTSENQHLTSVEKTPTSGFLRYSFSQNGSMAATKTLVHESRKALNRCSCSCSGMRVTEDTMLEANVRLSFLGRSLVYGHLYVYHDGKQSTK